MKYLIINSVAGIGSTGRISAGLCRKLSSEEGSRCILAYGRGIKGCEDVETHRIGSQADFLLHTVYARLCDRSGFGSRRATKKFIEWADAYDPDVVWLQNIHGYYLNVEELFQWIKAHPERRYRWTLHDCWAFTGHCAFFDAAGCSKWQTLCEACPQIHAYPKSLLRDESRRNFERKRAAFTGVKDMTLVVPSQWLKGLVAQSFLKEYPVEVVYNTIDTSVFKPTPSDFRKKYGLEDKVIILGVASVWEKRKGLEDFLKLAEELDERYAIVLVGLSAKQMKHLPSNVTGIMRTNSASELSQIYTAADVFFNPTYEDNYPTVNLEAEACGTRVITYNTGGSAETLKRPDSRVIEKGDYKALKELI